MGPESTSNLRTTRDIESGGRTKQDPISLIHIFNTTKSDYVGPTSLPLSKARL